MRYSKIISIICLAMLLMSTSIVAMAAEAPDNNKVIEWGYSSENPSGNIGTVTYENEDGLVGIQVNTDLIKEYIDAGDSSINLSVQKLFQSASNGKNMMSNLLADKGVTSLKENPAMEINEYNLIDSNRYNTYQEFADAISGVRLVCDFNITDANAVITINAHFCTNVNGEETLISFTDNAEKTAQQQYIDYCNSHPMPAATTSGGCFEEYSYIVSVEDGYTGNQHHFPDGNCPNGGWYNGGPCQCGHCVGWDEPIWIKTGNHNETRTGIRTKCGCTHGQIMSIESDYLAKSE